jgi:hypothetical protein
MARPAFGLVLVGWLCAAGAAFAALFDLDATDDYAGWVFVVVALQVPAIVALWPVRREALPRALRLALALSAALVTGVAVFWVAVPIGYLIWKPAWLELRPALLGLVVGLVAAVAAGVKFVPILGAVPHPIGARFVVLVVAVLGMAGATAMVLRFGVTAQPDWLAVAIPVAWALPLYFLAALQPRPEPPIPRAAVARVERPGD